jgi:hypothetical protein
MIAELEVNEEFVPQILTANLKIKFIFAATVLKIFIDGSKTEARTILHRSSLQNSSLTGLSPHGTEHGFETKSQSRQWKTTNFPKPK